MVDWDGRGLPPAARARLERANTSGVASSLLSVGGQVGIDACGFRAAGEVMGCVVMHIGWQGYGGCGVYYGNAGFGRYGGGYAAAPVSGTSGGYAGFAPYVDALNAGWDGAIGRMLAECRAIGGDGIVGVRLTERHLGEGNREFMALGTAVRSRGGVHLERPFATELAGSQVAKLLHSGWAPASTVVAISVSIRHDDWQTIQATRAFTTNLEVPGYTELANHARADARRVLARATKGAGADGAVLTAPMTLRMHGIEVGEGHTDHVAEATATATTVARFAHASVAPPRPLMILPLRDRSERR